MCIKNKVKLYNNHKQLKTKKRNYCKEKGQLETLFKNRLKQNQMN